MNHVIILAAGQGQRMNMKEDKLLTKVAGKPVLYYSIASFHDHSEIDQIIIVANRQNKAKIELLVKTYNFHKVSAITGGGLSRQESFFKGFEQLTKLAAKQKPPHKPAPEDIVLVHNGDNPLPSQEEITKVIEKATSNGAAIVGHPLKSTIKELNSAKSADDDETHVLKTHNRQKLFAAETPQVAQFAIFQKAITAAEKSASTAKATVTPATDEAMLLEAIGQKVATVPAHENNFKITTQGDLCRLRDILGETPEDFRVGIGQDSHEFSTTEKGLTIGGLLLPDQAKLEANSDGDVILHAIFNGISQAIGDKSLGFYADPMCQAGIKDSKKYLEPLLKKVKKMGFKVNSLGLMLECKIPKIDPIEAKLKASLSKIIDLPKPKIGITATTGENLTRFGRGLGIQCHAIISLKKV
jgi:2-C-methyl-D-erythritol 4-phosphate cytidylyltransferase / 2-C-methyl-D-erythritol 2,4-cyclodiphosphate synthase